jgi:phospholipase D1/2
MRGDGSHGPSDVQILITAADAYLALEQAFLTARSDILASFLVFDPHTLLRSDAGRAVGRTWFDLIVHTLRRGVAITLTLSDFDPIARAQMHRGTWHSLRVLQAAAEVAGPGSAQLSARAARHPGQVGWAARLAIAPVILVRVWRTADWLNRQTPGLRATALRDMPAVADMMVTRSDGRVRPRLWPVPTLHPCVHHQKIAVFDRSRLYVGGLDLNERRYDDHDHQRPGHQTWHDVQLMIDGPVAEGAARHLESFEAVTAGDQPPVDTGGLLVTLSSRRKGAPLGFGPRPLVRDIHAAHCAAIARARGLIYLESQYFRDQSLTRALCRAARSQPDLGLILLLPGAPEELAFDGNSGLDQQMGEWYQAHCLRKLQRAFGKRLFIGGAAQRRRGVVQEENGRDLLAGAPLIYIHAKLSVFDHAAIVSSANLNARSMRWDTESGVRLDNPETVALLRQRAMRHWLPKGADHGFTDPATAVAAWRGLALSNAARAPADRQGFVVPYDLRAAERFGTAVPFLPPEMV